MCKVFIMSGITNETRSNANKFISVMSDLMSTGNRDGLGYASVNENGVLFGERWLENKDAFVRPSDVEKLKAETTLPTKASNIINSLKGVIKHDSHPRELKLGEYNTFGKLDGSNFVAITMHTRMATSAKGHKNTHPFYDEDQDTSLIHNGIIRNESDFKLKLSTCDSESILISYLRNQVNIAPASVQSMANELKGYYACGVFSRDKDNKRILDVFKGNSASLHMCYVYDLKTFVITTSAFDIKEACEKLSFRYESIYAINEGFLMRFDPVTGELLAKEEFKTGSEWSYEPDRSWHNWRNKKTWEDWDEYNNGKKTLPQLPPAPVNKRKPLTAEMILYMKLPVTTEVFSMAMRKEYMEKLVAGV